MNKAYRAVLFVLMSAAMLAVPASQIFRHERVLQKGRAFRFRTAPVDPYDAFRGRFVALQFENLQGTLPAGMSYAHEKDVQAVIGEDEQGFAVVRALSEKPPAGMTDYVTMEIGWQSYEDRSNRVVRLTPPFSQFFMNEKLAPAAEETYRRMNRSGTSNVWAVVRVLNGKGVLEQLMFDGKPAAEYLTNKERP
jgi:uncharacterized membrane-anchored protein